MTDNEKAATFIGWREGAVYTECTHVTVDNVEYGCPTCIHSHPAPNMTRPENYMRAWEAVHSGDLYADVCFGTCAEGYFVRVGDDYTAKGIDDEHYDQPIEVSERTLGEAMVSALAALYDAEHPQ